MNLESDPFQLGPIIERIMEGTSRRTKMRKLIQKHSTTQRTRFEKWRDFVKGMNSGGKDNHGVIRGRIRGKKGRKTKEKKVLLDGGDIITDSQVQSCNKQVKNLSCQEEARQHMEKGIEVGFLNHNEGEKVLKIFLEWEKRDRQIHRQQNEEEGFGMRSSGQ